MGQGISAIFGGLGAPRRGEPSSTTEESDRESDWESDWESETSSPPIDQCTSCPGSQQLGDRLLISHDSCEPFSMSCTAIDMELNPSVKERIAVRLPPVNIPGKLTSTSSTTIDLGTVGQANQEIVVCLPSVHDQGKQSNTSSTSSQRDERYLSDYSLCCAYLCIAEMDSREFMMLPTELRLEILTLLVVFANPLKICAGLDFSMIVALSGTCLKLRKEVLDLFFSRNTFLVGKPTEVTNVLGDRAEPFLARVQHLEIDLDACEGWYYWQNEIVLMDSLKHLTIRLGPSEDWQVIFSDARAVQRLERAKITIEKAPAIAFLFMLKNAKPSHLTIKCIDHQGNCGTLNAGALTAMDKILQRNGPDRRPLKTMYEVLRMERKLERLLRKEIDQLIAGP